MEGDGYVVSNEIGTAVSEMVTYDVEFVGTGEPTFATV
jgi:hypothetical protein